MSNFSTSHSVAVYFESLSPNRRRLGVRMVEESGQGIWPEDDAKLSDRAEGGSAYAGMFRKSPEFQSASRVLFPWTPNLREANWRTRTSSFAAQRHSISQRAAVCESNTRSRINHDALTSPRLRFVPSFMASQIYGSALKKLRSEARSTVLSRPWFPRTLQKRPSSWSVDAERFALSISEVPFRRKCWRPLVALRPVSARALPLPRPGPSLAQETFHGSRFGSCGMRPLLSSHSQGLHVAERFAAGREVRLSAQASSHRSKAIRRNSSFVDPWGRVRPAFLLFPLQRSSFDYHFWGALKMLEKCHFLSHFRCLNPHFLPLSAQNF